MQISGLSASNTFSATDVLAIEVNVNGVEKTYKLTGAALAAALASIGSYLTTADVVNNLTSTSTNQPLSAAQGKELNVKLTPSIITASPVPEGMTKQYGNIYKMGQLVVVQLRLQTTSATPTTGKMYNGLPQPAPGHGAENDMIAFNCEGAAVSLETNGNVYYKNLTPGQKISISGCYISVS